MSARWAILRVATLVLAILLVVGCGGHAARSSEPGLNRLRRVGPQTQEPEVAGRWLLAELFSPGGDSGQAQRAREHLDALHDDPGMVGHFAQGLDDWIHGRLEDSPEQYLEALAAARGSDDPRAPLVAWMAARQAVLLSDSSPGIWPRWKKRVDEMIERPLNIGWRARSELLDWWSLEQDLSAVPDIENKAARRYGCAEHVRLAGPFGTGAKRDLMRAHAAEEPGPWPQRWPRATGRGQPPHILKTDQHGCVVYADEPVGDGIFYAETFVNVPADREILIAVQGAVAVWVDDRMVVHRDPRDWGVWPRFGAQVWLRAGRHRVLARVDTPRTSIRIAQPDGTPAPVTTSTDGAPAYSLVPPRVTADPNLISRYVRSGNITQPNDELTRLLLAYLAYIEGQGDVASVFFEPFVKDLGHATGPALVLSALFAEVDPVFPPTQVQDLVHELQQLSIEKDRKLWQSRLALALWKSDKSGPTKAIESVRELADQFTEVPGVSLALARLYSKLGWTAEYAEAVKELARRFPHSDEALTLALQVYESEGDHEQADQLAAEVQRLDPDSEVELTRALEREDYDAAVAELRRLGKRRPDRKDIAERIYGVLVRAGDDSETWKKLAEAVKLDPKDGRARLDLADARYATGNNAALREALVEGVTAGADIDPLESAIDLVEGVTELEPYRLKAKPIIAAYEKSGVTLPGHAARVLDYMAVWVKSDGSARLLEHEVVRIQSAEAISNMAEHERLSGLPLHMRVIKQDGRVLEPEMVPGKPSVTFPHLEVGDYIETEHIFSTAGDGEGGELYVGPHWFFREANVAYARSEFVVISPKAKKLIVEYGGGAPQPQREDVGAFEVRRWRVDKSPAAPSEPNSPPMSEFLPSVQIAWGISRERRLHNLHGNAIDLTPIDPRIVRIAERIVESAPASKPMVRAQKLYRWVMANVEEGEETDGRRVVIGKEGVRARGFETLCRALGIQVDYALARNKLMAPPRGPISRAMLYSQMVLRVGQDKESAWLTVGNKFAPFGYVPIEVRGMPAYVLTGPKLTKTKVPARGSVDGMEYVGGASLAANGSAKLVLTERFLGKHAMAARQDLSQLPARRLPDVLQASIAQSLRGALLERHDVHALDDLDSPLSIEMSVTMKQFAQPRGGSLVIQPPFSQSLSAWTALPTRETPLLMPIDLYQRVRLAIELPEGASVESLPRAAKITFGDRSVVIKDRVEEGKLVLDRTIRIPASRIQPDEYPDFVKFARRADEAQNASIRIAVR